MRIFRVVVRAHFDGLDEPTRDRLLSEADDHDYLRSAFTSTGTFTYDRLLVAFNLRYEVRLGDEVPADDAAAVAGETAMAMAARFLDGRHIGAKRLRPEVTDMASIWNR